MAPRRKSLAQDLGVDEFVAGGHEGFGGLLLAEGVDRQPRRTDAGGQSCDVVVGGHQPEAVHPAAMQQIHGVDDQGHLRQQFADHWGLGVVGIDQLMLGSQSLRVGAVLIAQSLLHSDNS